MLSYSEWCAKVAQILAESKIMQFDDEPGEVWQMRFDAGLRPSQAAAQAIDQWRAALRFKHI